MPDPTVKTASIQEAMEKMTSELEGVVSRLAMAADAGLPTYHLESQATKLASKIKASAWITTLTLYQDISKGNKEYYPHQLPMDLYSKFADLCKKSKDTDLNVYNHNDLHYTEIVPHIFVCLEELPEVNVPRFKFKIEGDTLMAVSSGVYAKLPEKMQKLLMGKEDSGA